MDTKKTGLEMRRQVMGDEFVDRALGNATDFTQPLQDFVNEHAWGAVWNRDGLPLKTRSLITLAALLGASPGASVTVSIMIELIEKCFPGKAKGEWAAKLAEIFPAREKVLETDAALYRKINAQNNISLELVEPAAETESYA